MTQRGSSDVELELLRELGTDFDQPPAGRQARFRLGHPLARLRAGLLCRSLDAALAQGADPCESPALAYRAARLTSDRSRERLATSVEYSGAAATRPAPSLSAAVQPCRYEVEAAGSLLPLVRELLRSTAPVYARGVAMLEILLTDGGSPLFAPASRGALSHELELIFAALQGREPRRSVLGNPKYRSQSAQVGRQDEDHHHWL